MTKEKTKLKYELFSLEYKKERLEDKISRKKLESISIQEEIDDKEHEIYVFSLSSIWEHFTVFVMLILPPILTMLVIHYGDKSENKIKLIMGLVTIALAIVKGFMLYTKDCMKKTLSEERLKLKKKKTDIDKESCLLTEELTKLNKQITSLKEEI